MYKTSSLLALALFLSSCGGGGGGGGDSLPTTKRTTLTAVQVDITSSEATNLAIDGHDDGLAAATDHSLTLTISDPGMSAAAQTQSHSLTLTDIAGNPADYQLDLTINAD